jgi:hypothetical protein
MTRHTASAFSLANIGLIALACGSAPPPKAEPAPTGTLTSAAAAGAPSVAATTAGTAALTSAATPQPQAEGASTPAASNAAEPPAPTAEPKLYPVDVLTGRETAFLVDYANSGAIEVANKNCSGKVEEDANKHAECLTKAREKFGADVLRFKKDDKGHVKLTIYRRSGSALMELYTANVELKEISTNNVKVEIKGGTSGQRPILRDRGNFEVKVPNGYSIELEDSVYGKLPYDAKVGLVAK